MEINPATAKTANALRKRLFAPVNAHQDIPRTQKLKSAMSTATHPYAEPNAKATPASSWDDSVDHLSLSYDNEPLAIAESHLSFWQCPETGFKVERTSSKNSVLITIPEVAEIAVNVVPVTNEDDRIHNYQIPENDCFAHLEVQFRFHGLSSRVEGVIGRTYRSDFENPAKPGVAMPVLGGEDRYRTTSLLAANCRDCLFSGAGVLAEEQGDKLGVEYGMLDCSGSGASGNGIVCRK
ncbi:hypothetical protein L484_010195 [Morus notabilis]|uniref:Uncharacterized protein n=1 Tax=Morus notabilis TaxID=981085 RepID=W9QI43_9ROSA|nr:hypothetical protein L484_010195 [Morus notabilis]